MPRIPTATLLDDDTRAILAYRGQAALWILFGLGSLVTATDLLTGGPDRAVLVGAGLARLLVLAVLLAVVRRASSEKWTVVPVVSGVNVIAGIGLLFGAWRHQFQTALMIDGGLCIAVAAFLPWGWRIQMLPVASTLLSIGATFAGYGWSVIAPQSLALTLTSLGVSIYFAVDQERTRRDLVSYNADIAAAHREIGRLNRELERRARARESMLEAATRRLESFCESLATDLRPSLAATHGHLDALRSLPARETSVESDGLVSRIHKAAVRMEETLDALLEYVALARAPLRPGVVDLSRQADALVRRLRDQEPHRHVDVVIQERMFVTGDTVLLTESLRHLVDNAWKFTGIREEGRIEIGERTTAGGQQQFFVRDNGVGFDMAHVGKLFQPFMRLEAVESFPGHGMGLARAARIIERHGGCIQAEAVPGIGAEFRFTLGHGR